MFSNNTANQNNTANGTNGVNGTATTVEQRSHTAAVHETVKPTQLEEVQPVVNRQVERTEIHQITQPIYEKNVLPTQVQSRVLPATQRADTVLGGPAPAMQTDVSSRVVENSQRSTVVKPAIIQETVRAHVVEEIQPVIYRETVQPVIIRETQPINEHVYSAPTIYQETRAPIYGNQMMQQQQPMMMQQQQQQQQQPMVQEALVQQQTCGNGNCANCNGMGNYMVSEQKHYHPFNSMFGRKHHDSGAHAGMLGANRRGVVGLPSSDNVGYSCNNCGHNQHNMANGYGNTTGYYSHVDNGLAYAPDVTYHSYRQAHRANHGLGGAHGNHNGGYNNGGYNNGGYDNVGYNSGLGQQQTTYGQQQQTGYGNGCDLHSHSANCGLGTQQSPIMLQQQQQQQPGMQTAYSALAPNSQMMYSQQQQPNQTQQHRSFFGRGAPRTSGYTGY